MGHFRGLLAVAVLTICTLLQAGCGGAAGTTPTSQPPQPVTSHDGGASLNSIQHIIFTLQENRSYDNYFGRMGEYRRQRGLTDQIEELPLGVQLLDRSGNLVSPFHFRTVCHEGTTPAWGASHVDVNGGKMDNFMKTTNASTIDPDGTRAMGYYDWTDLPYYYDLAFQFATSDSFFSSVLAPTIPNRMYLFAGTSFGHVEADPPLPLDHPTIFDRLTAAKVSWRYYYQSSNLIFLSSWTSWSRLKDHVFPISQYYIDLQDPASLPAVIYIERASGGFDERPKSNIQKGAASMKAIIDAFLQSPAYASSVFIFSYDEGGGMYDHVPPIPLPKPDNIEPILGPDDKPGEFNESGFRVPVIVMGPWVKPHHVSHVPRDTTSILRLIEKRFGVDPLTQRDALADDLTEFFDFTAPARPAPKTVEQPLDGVCDYLLEKPPGR